MARISLPTVVRNFGEYDASVADDPIAQYGALFERDGSRYVPTQLARGPWNPKALHGGAPSALVRDCLRDARSRPGGVRRPDHRRAHATGAARAARRCRCARSVRAARCSGSRRCSPTKAVTRLRARPCCASAPTTSTRAAPCIPRSTRRPPPDSAAGLAFPFGEGAVGFWNVHDVRLVRGSWTEPGPGVAWFRLLCPVVAGEPISPIARVAAAADFGSGVGESGATRPRRPRSIRS